MFKLKNLLDFNTDSNNRLIVLEKDLLLSLIVTSTD